MAPPGDVPFRGESGGVSSGVTACESGGASPDVTAELWLGGDNHLGRLNLWGGTTWISGLVATRHSFLNRVAEVASCPEDSLAQPSNLGLGLVPELPIPAP